MAGIKADSILCGLSCGRKDRPMLTLRLVFCLVLFATCPGKAGRIDIFRLELALPSRPDISLSSGIVDCSSVNVGSDFCFWCSFFLFAGLPVTSAISGPPMNVTLTDLPPFWGCAAVIFVIYSQWHTDKPIVHCSTV